MWCSSDRARAIANWPKSAGGGGGFGTSHCAHPVVQYFPAPLLLVEPTTSTSLRVPASMGLFDPSSVEWWLPATYLLLVALAEAAWSCRRIFKSSAESPSADESLAAPLLHGKRVRAQHQSREGERETIVLAWAWSMVRCFRLALYELSKLCLETAVRRGCCRM